MPVICNLCYLTGGLQNLRLQQKNKTTEKNSNDELISEIIQQRTSS
jgi:hypothetical protein